MKRIAILGIITLFVFVSCKKSGTDTNYHVSITVDGVTKTYTGYVRAGLDTTAGYKTLTVIGADSSTAFNNYFGFYLDNSGNNSSPITAGQYDDTSTDFILLANFTKNAVEYEAGQSVAEDAAVASITINHFKVTITSMSNGTIRGTFSGDFFEDGDVQSGTKLSITNGEFYLILQ